MALPEETDSTLKMPLRLLSLDGGGVRGLSTLMIVQRIMDNIESEEKNIGLRDFLDHSPLRPCDYFDLIGGTSTGGIIAILLGRLRLTCQQSIEVYRSLAQEIFQHDRSLGVGGLKLPLTGNRFSGSVLEQAIKRALQELGFAEDELMWDPSLFESGTMTETRRDSLMINDAEPDSSKQIDACKANEETEEGPSITTPSGAAKQQCSKGCRAFVVTTMKNALGMPRLFTTYSLNDRSTRVWEALRATSAAPTFFEEMPLGSPRVTYLDGGVGFNNPCAEVDFAAKSIWGNQRPIGAIVSIGTGLQTLPRVKTTPVANWLPFGLGTDIALVSALAGMATGTSRVDNEMERMYHGTDTAYYRFDVEGGLADVSLEEFMREDEMGALTQQYLHEATQAARVSQLAKTMLGHAAERKGAGLASEALL